MLVLRALRFLIRLMFSLFMYVLVIGAGLSFYAEARECRPSGPHIRIADVDGDGIRDRLVRCFAPRSLTKSSPPIASLADSSELSCEDYMLYGSKSKHDFRVARRCDDSGGISNKDKIRVRRSMLYQTRRGGAAWKWRTTCEFDLNRRKVLRLKRNESWSRDKRHRRRLFFDLERAERLVKWQAPRCLKNRRVYRGAFSMIPVSQAVKVGELSWKKHDAKCLLSLSRDGFSVSPRYSTQKEKYRRRKHRYRGAEDTEVLLWAFDTEGALVIRGLVRDNKKTSNDRLHLWLGVRDGGFSADCIKGGASHWTSQDLSIIGEKRRKLALKKDRTEALKASGAGVSLFAKRVTNRLLFEFILSPKRRQQALRHGISFAYADSDDPAKPARHYLATSTINPKHGIGLGELVDCHCQLEKGKLKAQPIRSCMSFLP